MEELWARPLPLPAQDYISNDVPHIDTPLGYTSRTHEHQTPRKLITNDASPKEVEPPRWQPFYWFE
eukprot:3174883-Prymnesium_polylepis.1